MKLDENRAPYPIVIQYVPEAEKGYYIAYLPDFGWSACSAPGDTMQKAIENLQDVAIEVTAYFKETGRRLPQPSVWSDTDGPAPRLDEAWRRSE